MLPPRLKSLKDALELKGNSNRTVLEDQIHEELVQVDSGLEKAKAKDKSITESLEKHAYGAVGTLGVCPMCGK